MSDGLSALLDPSDGTLKEIYRILSEGNFGVHWMVAEDFKDEYGRTDMVILLPMKS